VFLLYFYNSSCSIRNLILVYMSLMQVNPTGNMVKLVLLSTHGDTFYIGLNGLAIYDSDGNKININPEQLQGTPSR
jgi:Domain of unknown function (DUF4457)